MHPYSYRVFFLASELPGGLEIDAKIDVIIFVILTRVLDGADMEWNRKSVDGKHNSESFFIDIDLHQDHDQIMNDKARKERKLTFGSEHSGGKAASPL